MGDNRRKTGYNRKVAQLARDSKGDNSEKNKTPKQRQKARKRRRINVIIGLAAYGIASFLAGKEANNLLNPGVDGVSRDGNEVVIDLDKTGEDITFKGNAHQQFVQSLVDQTIDKQIEDDIRQELGTKTTLEERLDYIKDIYVKEYNEVNEKDITTDDMKFYKNLDEFEQLYENENGNIIIISEKDAIENNIDTLRDNKYIYVEIQTEEGLKIERAIEYNGKFVPVYYYEPSEINSENLLCSEGMGNVILAGAELVISNNHKDENNPNVNSDYEDNVINAIREYRKIQIEKVMNGDNIERTGANQEEWEQEQ